MWYSIISRDPKNFENLAKALEHFNEMHAEAQQDLKINDKKLNTALKEIAGLVEYRYGQLQEIEAILELYNRELLKEKTLRKRFYMEKYERTLSERLADQYAEIDETVLQLKEFVEVIALTRNKFLGIMKGLENMSFRLSDITRLRMAGIEDAII